MAQLLAPRRGLLSALFDQMLDVIEDAFQARKMFLVRGVVVDGGPDHYARLEAVEMVLSWFIHAGDVRSLPVSHRDHAGGCAADSERLEIVARQVAGIHGFPPKL